MCKKISTTIFKIFPKTDPYADFKKKNQKLSKNCLTNGSENEKNVIVQKISRKLANKRLKKNIKETFEKLIKNVDKVVQKVVQKPLQKVIKK